MYDEQGMVIPPPRHVSRTATNDATSESHTDAPGKRISAPMSMATGDGTENVVVSHMTSVVNNLSSATPLGGAVNPPSPVSLHTVPKSQAPPGILVHESDTNDSNSLHSNNTPSKSPSTPNIVITPPATPQQSPQTTFVTVEAPPVKKDKSRRKLPPAIKQPPNTSTNADTKNARLSRSRSLPATSPTPTLRVSFDTLPDPAIEPESPEYKERALNHKYNFENAHTVAVTAFKD